jgi:hypothetical protein
MTEQQLEEFERAVDAYLAAAREVLLSDKFKAKLEAEHEISHLYLEIYARPANPITIWGAGKEGEEEETPRSAHRSYKFVTVDFGYVERRASDMAFNFHSTVYVVRGDSRI